MACPVSRRLGFGLIASLALVSVRARADELTASPRAPVDDVSVAGVRMAEMGGSAQIISEKQLRRFSYDDPLQVMLSVPGVYVRQEDGMGLRPNIGIRGANSDRSKKVTLMEDGVLVGPAPYSAPAAYYFPLIDRMQTVRVVKGPASVVHGPQTVGGAIDLVTREIPSERKGTYDFAFGQYGYNKQHVSYGASDEHAGFLIEGMRLDNSGFKVLDGGGDTGFTRNEWMAKASYNPDPRAAVQNEFRVKLGYSDEGSNETYLGLPDAAFRANPDRRFRASAEDRMDFHRTAVQVSHHLRVSPDMDVTTTAYRHDFTRSWRKVNSFRGADLVDVLKNPGTQRNAIYAGILRGEVDSADASQAIQIGPNNRKFVSQGVQAHVSFRARTGPLAHHVVYGVRAHYDEIVRKHTQDGFLLQGGQLVPDGLVTEVTADNKASTHALSLYVTDAMTLGPLTLTPGLRIEAIHAAYRDALTKVRDGKTYRVIIPGVSAHVAVRRDVGLFVGVHKGFSPVPPEQASGAEAEESVNYEAGARLSRRHLRAELIGFYNDYSNLTNICGFSSGCTGQLVDRQFEAGRARIGGLEALADLEATLPDGWVLPARVAYTYTYTEFLTSFRSADPQFGDVVSGDELPYVPAHQINASVGIEKRRFGLNVAGTFVDAMWERAGKGTAPDGAKTDAYFLLDASAKVRVLSQVELYLNGRNLANDRYIASRRPYGARPGAPLWVMAGVRGEF